MTQVTKIIDVSKSFMVLDPNAMPENLSYTTKEDAPEDAAPIIAYEGYNFLPTSYGYKSFFGENSILDTTLLTSKVDHAFIFQMGNFQNALIALCDDGIWFNIGAGWVHGITLSVPTVGSHLEWTYTIIENILYMYRQGDSLVYKLGYTDFLEIAVLTGFALSSYAISMGDAAPTITAPTSGSAGAITYTSNNPAVATITSGGIITIVADGSVTFTAHQAANGIYAAAVATSSALVVSVLVTIVGTSFVSRNQSGLAPYTGIGTAAIPIVYDFTDVTGLDVQLVVVQYLYSANPHADITIQITSGTLAGQQFIINSVTRTTDVNGLIYVNITLNGQAQFSTKFINMSTIIGSISGTLTISSPSLERTYAAGDLPVTETVYDTTITGKGTVALPYIVPYMSGGSIDMYAEFLTGPYAGVLHITSSNNQFMEVTDETGAVLAPYTASVLNISMAVSRESSVIINIPFTNSLNAEYYVTFTTT